MIDVGDVEDTLKWGKFCLIGKIISEKSFPFEVFRTTMQKIWKVAESLSFSDVGANKFIMEFQLVADLLKIKRGCPWMFDRHLVILQDFDGYISIKDMQFDKEYFWVQFHDLPLGGMNKLVGERLGSAIGSFPVVDVDQMALDGVSI